MNEPDRPSLLMYCQHSLGVGHLRRSRALVAALAARFRVCMVNGGAPVPGLETPAEVEEIALPPLAQGIDGRLVSLDPSVSAGAAQRVRRRAIATLYRERTPAVVMIEMFPFGRTKFRSELLPLLHECSRNPSTIVACSLHDLLLQSRRGQQDHDDRAAALANEHFGIVAVHTDPSFARLEETFAPRIPLRVPVQYTGFVTPEREAVDHSTPPPAIDVVVSAGRGRYGESLFAAALDAQVRLRSRQPCRMTIVAGPLCLDRVWHKLTAVAAERPDLTLHRHVPDLYSLMATARVSVSQCGYNTTLDLIQSRVPAVVVPFSDRWQDEQASRARRLARLGIVDVLDPRALSGASLAAAILAARAQSAASLQVDGARQTADLLAGLVDRRRQRETWRA